MIYNRNQFTDIFKQTRFVKRTWPFDSLVVLQFLVAHIVDIIDIVVVCIQ